MKRLLSYGNSGFWGSKTGLKMGIIYHRNFSTFCCKKSRDPSAFSAPPEWRERCPTEWNRYFRGRCPGQNCTAWQPPFFFHCGVSNRKNQYKNPPGLPKKPRRTESYRIEGISFPGPARPRFRFPDQPCVPRWAARQWLSGYRCPRNPNRGCPGRSRR